MEYCWSCTDGILLELYLSGILLELYQSGIVVCFTRVEQSTCQLEYLVLEFGWSGIALEFG